MTGFWDDAEVISVYTREQAVEDGTLVSLDEETLPAEAGFNCSVALTRGLFELVSPTEAERERYGQSYTGRLWDVLNMARMYSRAERERDTAGEGVDVFFPCIFTICGRDDVTKRTGAKFTGQKTYKLWFSLAPGDDGEPVVTIGFPGDR
jgi:hypothetical protein